MSPSVPSKIGKYNVLGVIGRGGMGIVYKAIDPRLDRQVAIKMMTGGFVDNPDLRKRFFREAQSLGSLQHPNIVTVYDLGDHDGNPYLVMQYLEGETLDTVFTNKRPLSFLEKTNIVIQVCNGLAYAHQRCVVHRDIKPANIMLEKNGGVKIFDFGIAHVGDQNVTKTGQMVGTPPYMSPEQVNGKPVDARSDLFSTGIVLYQLFTDHLPFEGDTAPNTFLKILYDPPPPLRTFLSSYPSELDVIIERALAKDPGERYHSADEFAVDLGQLQAQFRQEVIGKHMREVSILLERSELHRARELLLQTLRVDPQHTPATQLLRDIERRIRKEEIHDQVRRLRQQAEEAVAQGQLETAKSFLDQAIGLDNSNPDLRRLAESVRAAVAQAQKLRTALKAAESAHQDGDLDGAKQAVEEALQVAPDDTQAKALYRLIQRDWAERSRLRQLENHLFQARQHISSRKFSAAIETLKLAEKLDPGAPQISALMETAQSGLDQEQRRKDVDAIVRDIESALNADDYRGACQKADQGLARFPDERTLSKLKALADRQRQIEERRQFVEDQLSNARKLLQVSKNEELLTSLKDAIAKIGPEPRLQSLLTIVTENVQRERQERRKTEYLSRAKEFLRNQEYDSAIRTLEAARAELKNEPEVEDLLQFVKEEAATEKRRRAAEAAAEKAQVLVADQKYDDAVRLLEAALRENPDPELRIALTEARRGAAEYQERMSAALSSAERLLQARRPNEAVKLLESQPAAYFRNPALAKLLETARVQAERMRRIREVIEQSQRLSEDGDYAAARSVLDEWKRKNGPAPEIDAQASLVEDRRLATARRIGEKAIADARVLVKGGEYQAGLDKLRLVAQFVVDLPEVLATEYRSLERLAAAGLVESRKSDIERSVNRGELTMAGDLLQQLKTEFPEERGYTGLGKVVEGETSRRSTAQQKLAEAQQAFDEEAWRAGGNLLTQAYASSDKVPPLRQRVIDAFIQAAFLAVETDWRAAEALVQQLAELKPDYDPPSLLRLQIRDREHEEAVGRHLAHAKALLTVGQFQQALNELSAGLKSHPDDVSLLELKRTVLDRIRQEEDRSRQEKARLEKEAFLRDVSSRIEREAVLAHRVDIIEEALGKFPQDQQLLQLSTSTHDLIARVSSLTEQARALEEAGKFDEALAQWSTLRSLHRLQPELEENIARLTRQRDQARVRAKSDWLERIRRELAASDFDRARALLQQAAQQFPRDQDLALLDVQLGDAIKARAKAEKYLPDVSKAFERSKWEKGIEALNRVLEIAGNDAVIQGLALNHLVKASESVLATDVETAQMLLDRAAMLRPTSPAVLALERKIEERDKELGIVARLNSVRRTQQSGDLEGARLELILAIKAFPGEQRFVDAKLEIERQQQRLEEQQTREREKALQLELERERERERKRHEEVERERARQRAREQEEERRRLEAADRERRLAEETERKRLEEEKQEQLRAVEEERKRLAAIEQERQRAEEAERERVEEEKQAKLRAEQAERERVAAIDRERLATSERERKLAEEAERKRLEEEKQTQLRAAEEERKRLAAIEQERLRAEEAERKKLEEEKQAKLRVEQAEQERLAAIERERVAAIERERKLAEEAERKRLAEEKQARLRAEEAERKKLEEEKQAKLRAEEAERKRLEDEKLQKLRAEEEEHKRQEAAERERIRAEQAEKKRLEEQKKEQERAAEAERKRQEAAEGEKAKAAEAKRKRVEEEEKQRVRAAEAERKRLEEIERQKVLAAEREKERQRQLVLEQERQAAEKVRLEEQKKAREEALRKEEQARQEKALAKQREREEKAAQKAQKEQERVRLEAAAAEKRKQEKEAQRQREEDRRQQSQKQKEEAARRATAPEPDISATRVMDKPVPLAPGAAPGRAVPPAERTLAARLPFHLAALDPKTRYAIIAGAAVVLLVVVIVIWRAMLPNTIAVQVTTTPDGASVALAPTDHPAEKRQCVTPHCSFDLAPGKYSLEIAHDGYEPARQTIEVAEHGTRSFAVSLMELAPATNNGGGTSPNPNPEPRQSRLEMRGLTPGSEAFVDDKSIGRVGHNGEIWTSLPAGQHTVNVLAKNEKSSIVSRNFGAGRTVSLSRDDLFPTSPPSPEEQDWQKTLGSQTIDSLSQFIGKYPSSAHRTDAVNTLEALYWIKDSRANTVEAYREYLTKFPQATHSAAAQEELDFLEAGRDPARLDAFATNHPHSGHLGEVNSRRDDLAWEHTNRDDESSLNIYLRSHPNGKYADAANSLVAKMHPPAKTETEKVEPPPPPPSTPSQKELDEKSIRSVIKQYEKAFTTRDVEALLKVWPSMGSKNYATLKTTFASVSAFDMEVDLEGIEINSNGATARATATRTQDATPKGGKKTKAIKDQPIFDLKKFNGTWFIYDVR